MLFRSDPDAIVYPTAEGKHIRITRDDFPSEEEFLAFKKWSDENFHEEEKLDHRESNHTLAADELSEAALAVPATDVLLERRYSREEKRRAASEMVVKLKDKLTETQFRKMCIRDRVCTFNQYPHQTTVRKISTFSALDRNH